MFKVAQLEEKEIYIDGEKLSDLRLRKHVALTTDIKDMEHHLNTVTKPRGVEEAGCKIYSGAPTVSRTTG